jgi:hypothetical protein
LFSLQIEVSDEVGNCFGNRVEDHNRSSSGLIGRSCLPWHSALKPQSACHEGAISTAPEKGGSGR